MNREQKIVDVFGAANTEFPLPAGWYWVRLGDIAEIVGGNSPAGSSYNREGRGLPLINGPTEFGPRAFDHPTAVQFTEAPSRICEAGDLLVCVRGSTTGRTNVASFRAAIGRDIAAVRGLECQPYINHYVASRADQLRSMGTGSTLTGITVIQLRELAVPLPPVSEQHRIVAAIDESVAEIDGGVDALVRARADLLRLRAAVFRSAVTGELTSAMRLASPTRETAVDLLKRILSQSDAESAAVSSEAGLFAHQAHEEPALHDPLQSGALPPAWTWATLSQLCRIQLGRAKSPSKRSNHYPTKYLRAANITDEGLDLSDVQEMEFEPHEREAFRLRKGDLIVAEASGSADKVGKPAAWNDELPLCCFQNTVIRLHPYVSDSSYILLLLRHCYFNHVFANLSDGMGINHLGAGRLARVVVPLAPEAEQKVMVDEVDHQLESIKSSTQVIDSNLDRAADLRRSVLARAFDGSLVDPKPTNEVAQSLAERISVRLVSDRAAASAEPKQKRISKMKTDVHRPLLDVLKEHPNGLTPEALLVAANYTFREVEQFYSELSRIADRVREDKPQGDAAKTWPIGARVLLSLRKA